MSERSGADRRWPGPPPYCRAAYCTSPAGHTGRHSPLHYKLLDQAGQPNPAHATCSCHPADVSPQDQRTPPVVLIRDDPAWTYPSPTGPASRRLRVWDLGLPTPRCLMAVITEAGPGMSITNAAVEVKAALAAEYPGDWLEIIEHWPAGAGCDEVEHYDQVEVLPFCGPQWRRLDSADLASFLPGLVPIPGAPQGAAHS
jgi:hypothetical protein